MDTIKSMDDYYQEGREQHGFESFSDVRFRETKSVGAMAKRQACPNSNGFDQSKELGDDPLVDSSTRFSCRRLAPEEEKSYSAIVQNSFTEACVLIQQNPTDNTKLIALQKEVTNWSSKGRIPVPQKRKVYRIRKTLFEIDHSNNSTLSKGQQKLILDLLDNVDRAADELILGNLALVYSLALKFLGKGIARSDLIQEGNIGLMKAAYRYDSSKARFTTYASLWIRQAMGRAISTQSRTIRLPSYLWIQRNRFFKHYYKLKNEYGHAPNDREISKRLGVPMRLVEIFKTSPPVESLDAPVSENNADFTLGDLLTDSMQNSADEIMDQKKKQQVIREVLGELPPKEATVIKMRFGIDGLGHRTLSEIGLTIGVSRERVRQIEKEAITRLRHPVRRNKLQYL